MALSGDLRSHPICPLSTFSYENILKDSLYKRRYDEVIALQNGLTVKINKVNGRTIFKALGSVEKRARKDVEE